MAEYKFGQLLEKEPEEETLEELEQRKEQQDQQEYQFGQKLEPREEDPLTKESKSRLQKTPQYFKQGGIDLLETYADMPEQIFKSIKAQAFDDLLEDLNAQLDSDEDTSSMANQLTRDRVIGYGYIRSEIEKDVGLKKSFFGSGDIALTRKPKEELEEIREKTQQEFSEWRESWDKETSKKRAQREKRYKQAGFTDRTDQTITGAVTSIGLVAPSLIASYVTKNPAASTSFALSSLPIFGTITYGEVFEDSVARGMSIKDATANAKIQATSEVVTELTPAAKIAKGINIFKKGPGDQYVKEILENGAAAFIADQLGEQFNTLVQTHSNAYFDNQDELRIAYDNYNNPFYEGRSVPEIIGDNLAHTALGSFIAGGTITGINTAVQLSPQIKSAIKSKGEQEGQEILNELSNLVANKDMVKIALDKAAIKLNSPEMVDNNSVDPMNIIAEELLNIDFVGQTEALTTENMSFAEEVQTKFQKSFDEKVDYQYGQTEQILALPKKEAGELTSEIDFESGPNIKEQVTKTQNNLVLSLPETSLLNVERIKNDSYDANELSLVKQHIVEPRKFDKNIFQDLPVRFSDTNLYRVRDLSADEIINVSKAFIDIKDMVPIDVFSDLSFIGAHVKDERFKNFSPAYGTYMPELQGITLSPISGLSNLDFENPLGAKIFLRDVFMHELGHHIDFTIGKDLSIKDRSIYRPVTAQSPLFDLPPATFKDGVMDIKTEQGGVVMKEALEIFEKTLKTPEDYYGGHMLSYPLGSFVTNADQIQMDGNWYKSETFAQMFVLYNNNRELFRESAPETTKLIERINDALSVDGFSKKAQGLYTAFQSPLAQRSFAVPDRGADNQADRQGTQDQTADTRVEGQEREPDRNDIRLSVPRLNSTALLDFIKQNPEGFTVDPITLESPTSGFAVAPIKALEIVLDQNKMTEADAIQFYNNVADLSEQMDQPVFAGGWLNPEDSKYYLDATIVFDNIEDALYTADIPTLNKEGKLEKQKAIFDLKTFNETETEQGIQELKDSGRFSSEARGRQETRITELSKLFEESRNRSSQEIERKVDPEPEVDPSFEITQKPAPPGKPPSENYEWSSGDELNSGLMLQWLLTKFQNQYERQVVLEEVIEDQLGMGILKDLDLSVVDRMDLMKSIVGDKMLKVSDEISNMLDKMFELADNDYGKITDFLYNLHAPERNKYIFETRMAKVDAAMEKYGDQLSPGQKAQITKLKNLAEPFSDNGSGIKTDDAIFALANKYGIEYNKTNDTIKAINEKGKKYIALSKLAQKFIQGTRDVYTANGLVAKENVDDWVARYKYYIPLSGFAADTNADGLPNRQGKGLSVYGLEVPKAKGRTSLAGDPIIQMYKQRENAVVRAEKNEVATTLANQARTFKNPKVYETLEKVPREAKLRPEWDPIRGSGYVFFKEDGKQKAVIIRDERLARALQHLDTQGMHKSLQYVAMMTRFMSIMNTGWNVDFMFPNFSRDGYAATASALGEQSTPGGRIYGSSIIFDSIKGILPSLGELFVYYRKGPEGIKDPEKRKLVEMYHAMGSKTSYFEFLDTDKLTKNFTALAKYRAGKISAEDLKRNTLDLIGDINNVLENGWRFSQFKAFIRQRGGVDNVSMENKRRAAVQAKNASVNFDRRGEWGQEIGAFLMFFNPAVQGSVQFMRGQNIFTKRGRRRLQPAKIALSGGAATIGMLYGMYNILISDEDEDGELVYKKIPEYERNRNLLLLLPDEIKIEPGEGLQVKKFGEIKKYMDPTGEKPIALATPLAYGYNVHFNIGRLFVETQADKIFPEKFKIPVTTIEEAGYELADSFITSFSPISPITTEATGLDGLLARTRAFAPSPIMRPFLDIAANETYFGGPITKEDFPYSVPEPKFKKAFRSTNKGYVDFTKALNDMTGGNDYRSGWADLDPNQLKYFIDYHAGGFGRTIGRVTDLPRKRKLGIDSFEDYPIFRSAVAEPQDFINGSRYYKRKDEIEALAYEYKNLDFKQKAEFRKNENMEIVKLGDIMTPEEKRIFNKRSKAVRDASMPKLLKAEKDLKEIRDKMKTAQNLYQIKDPDRYSELMLKYDQEVQLVYLKFNKEYNKALRKAKEKKKEDNN